MTFRVAAVPGVTPDKWVRRWTSRHPGDALDVVRVEEREQTAVLHDGRAQMSFVRLPADREGLHLIPLYSEVWVVVLPADHALAEFDTLERGDLSGDLVLSDQSGLSAKVAVETVAAGTGIVFLPMSVARVHQRKDVRAVPVSDLPETQIGLAWRVDDEDPRVEEFIGIVRGRTERSSRGAAPAEPAEKAPAQKKAPVKKAAAKKKTPAPRRKPAKRRR